MSPTHQDLSNDTTFSQIKSRVPVPLMEDAVEGAGVDEETPDGTCITQSAGRWLARQTELVHICIQCAISSAILLLNAMLANALSYYGYTNS